MLRSTNKFQIFTFCNWMLSSVILAVHTFRSSLTHNQHTHNHCGTLQSAPKAKKKRKKKKNEIQVRKKQNSNCMCACFVAATAPNCCFCCCHKVSVWGSAFFCCIVFCSVVLLFCSFAFTIQAHCILFVLYIFICNT